MSNFLLSLLIVIGSCLLGQFLSVGAQFLLPHADLIELQETQRRDRSCFEKFDSFLANLWEVELNGTDITDVGTIPDSWSFKEPSKPKYNTQTQEWLMEDADPIIKLRTCSDGLYKSVIDKLDKETKTCSHNLFQKLIRDEEKYAQVTKNVFDDKADLPFREFLSFVDIKYIVFQNRSYANLTSHEQSTYGHMESFVPYEEDKNERAWILRQECDWKDLKKLREATNYEEIFTLFKNQTLRTVDYVLGNSLVSSIDLAANISHKNFAAWLEARKNMQAEINAVIEKLKSVKKDSQWICEYASELGNKFAAKQEAILISDSHYYIDLKTYEISNKARFIEDYLKTLNDTRRQYFNDLANKFESEMHCVVSVMNMLTDHQSYELATSFIGKNLSYPQLFCRQKNLSLGLLAPMYCKCFGSFCVSHDIAALYSERLKLEKNESLGTYSVVTTNVDKPTQKVLSWPGFKEI